MTDKDATIAQLTAERDALRSCIIVACDEGRSIRADHVHLWAIREAANQLSEPFSHEKVQRIYDERDPNLSVAELRNQLANARHERDSARAMVGAELQGLEQQKAEAIRRWQTAEATVASLRAALVEACDLASTGMRVQDRFDDSAEQARIADLRRLAEAGE